MANLRLGRAAKKMSVHAFTFYLCAAWSIAALSALQGCHGKEANREAAEAPPSTPAVVDASTDNSVHVSQPQRFPLAAGGVEIGV